MAECPFCTSEVDEDLIIFGGSCPKCFADIPGEETPTDPGETVRAQQEAADRRTFRLWALVRMAAVGVFVLGVAGTAVALYLRPEAPLDLIDFDDTDFFMPEIEELTAYVAPEPEPEVVAANTASGTSRGTGEVGAGLSGFEAVADVGSEIDVSSIGANTGVEAAELRGPRTGTADEGIGDLGPVSDGSDVSLSTGVSLGGIGDIAISRRWQQGVVLEDDKVIIEHVRDVMRTEGPKLTQCYQRYLKSDEDLAGRWRLDFTVGADSVVKDVSVTGEDMSHAEFEACLVAKVAEWKFNPLKADQPIRKTISFKPK